MSRIASVTTAIAILACIAVASTAAGTSSGVFGIVTKSPTKPTCTEGQSCSAPASSATVQALVNGKVARQTVTGSNGSYRLPLHPGSYTLRVVGAFKGGTVRVTVGAGWTRRNLKLDTGIRGPGATVGG